MAKKEVRQADNIATQVSKLLSSKLLSTSAAIGYAMHSAKACLYAHWCDGEELCIIYLNSETYSYFSSFLRTKFSWHAKLTITDIKQSNNRSSGAHPINCKHLWAYLHHQSNINFVGKFVRYNGFSYRKERYEMVTKLSTLTPFIALAIGNRCTLLKILLLELKERAIYNIIRKFFNLSPVWSQNNKNIDFRPLVITSPAQVNNIVSFFLLPLHLSNHVY